MLRDTPVHRIMTCDVASIDLGAQLSTARRLLEAHPFEHIPITRDGQLVGLISASDLAPLTLKAYVRDSATVDAWLDASFQLREVMSTDLRTVHADDPVSRAAEYLAEGSFHCVPVVDRDGVLVGIVTPTDLIRALAAH